MYCKNTNNIFLCTREHHNLHKCSINTYVYFQITWRNWQKEEVLGFVSIYFPTQICLSLSPYLLSPWVPYHLKQGSTVVGEDWLDIFRLPNSQPFRIFFLEFYSAVFFFFPQKCFSINMYQKDNYFCEEICSNYVFKYDFYAYFRRKMHIDWMPSSIPGKGGDWCPIHPIFADLKSLMGWSIQMCGNLSEAHSKAVHLLRFEKSIAM